MTKTLVIVHVVGPVIETVHRVRQHPEESDDGFLHRTIQKAKSIVRGSGVQFDAGTDSCGIFSIEESNGEGTHIWAFEPKDGERD